MATFLILSEVRLVLIQDSETLVHTTLFHHRVMIIDQGLLTSNYVEISMPIHVQLNT